MTVQEGTIISDGSTEFVVRRKPTLDFLNKSYLPLSGGQPTGKIRHTGDWPLIVCANNSSYQCVAAGGSDTNVGGNLYLFGQDSSYGSSFQLRVTQTKDDGSITYIPLEGKINGQLKWNGSSILTASRIFVSSSRPTITLPSEGRWTGFIVHTEGGNDYAATEGFTNVAGGTSYTRGSANSMTVFAIRVD